MHTLLGNSPLTFIRESLLIRCYYFHYSLSINVLLSNCFIYSFTWFPVSKWLPVLLLSHVWWMAWIHSSNQPETQALMTFLGESPRLQCFKNNHNCNVQNSLAKYRWALTPYTNCSFVFWICHLPHILSHRHRRHHSSYKWRTWNQGRLHLSSALKDNQDPLLLVDSKRRPEKTNNMNKGMNAVGL